MLRTALAMSPNINERYCARSLMAGVVVHSHRFVRGGRVDKWNTDCKRTRLDENSKRSLNGNFCQALGGTMRGTEHPEQFIT